MSLNWKHPEDRTIIATADDAILAKFATVKAGYYDDPFLEPFSHHAAGIAAAGSRRPRQVQPIIKRGTHARVCCMDRAIQSFVDYHQNTSAANTGKRAQVLVLGCGKDTSFFRHGAANAINWFEVDHSSVVQRKASIIQGSPDIFKMNVQTRPNGFSLQSTNKRAPGSCFLLEHDLRDPPTQLLEKLKSIPEFDFAAPILIVLECVLMYLPDDASRSLLSNLTQQLTEAYLVAYEPILGNDAFGKVMEQNLSQAGVAGPTTCLRVTRTLEAQLDKALATGFRKAVGCDMAVAYDCVVSPPQRVRANQSEFLDELEEWLLIMRHYCFFVASSSSTETTFGQQFCAVGPKAALGLVEGRSLEKTQEKN